MNLISRIFNTLRGARARPATPIGQSGALPTPAASPRIYFDTLKAYYLNNALYDDVTAALRKMSVWNEAMKPLRNPAFRAVEFYASTLWPGVLTTGDETSAGDALPIQARNAAIVEPIRQIWSWSNWTAQKQVAARWFGCYGNLFIKTAQRADGRPYLQLIEPQNVPAFTLDERGYITEIRIDTPQARMEDGRTVSYVRTEYWSKPDNAYRVYIHSSIDAPLEQLPAPAESRTLDEFGIDFVPVVFRKMRDIGDPWGVGAFAQCLDKIDEGNRIATRMHQMLFRHSKNTWAVRANATDAQGRPLPAPRMTDDASSTQQKNSVMLGDDEIWYLPGNSELESLVPKIDYAAMLAILQDHMRELEHDLPELAYYRLRDFSSQLSGKAVRLLLTDAVARAVEARAAAESALAQADAMALTLGINAGIFPAALGTYANGDFDHAFAPRDVLPADRTELLQDLVLEQSLGVPETTLWKKAGYSEAQVQDMLAERDQTMVDAGNGTPAAERLITTLTRR